MGVSKTITIDGVDVQFKASAAIPRLYRLQFRRDLFHDFADLQKSVDDEKEKDSEASGLNPEILETFENVAYMMAKHADPKGVPGTAEEWLEQFSMFSIYEILPELLELWNANLQTQVQSKKNIARLTAPLFLLRCVQIGLSISDLDFLTIGLVNDLFTEKENDGYPYSYQATQADFDKF